MADNSLQELFSRLKAQPSEPAQSESPIWTASAGQPYQQPAVSSPIISPPSQTPNPIHASNIISPVNPASAIGSPAPDQNRTNNLLNLLKFNNQGSQAGPMANLQNVGGVRSGSAAFSAVEGQETTQARPLSAQDLMASFQRKPSSQSVISSPLAGTRAGTEKLDSATSQSNNSKDFLLNLLTKPKEQKPVTQTAGSQSSIAQPTVPQNEDDVVVDRLAQSLADTSVESSILGQPQHESTSARDVASADPETSSLEAPQPTKPSMFNYVNPFDQLHSSSPLNRVSPTPQGQAEPKKFEILRHNRDESSSSYTEPAVSAFMTKTAIPANGDMPSPPLAEPEKGKSVSEALEDVGEKVDQQVEEALAQADAQEKVAEETKAIPAQHGDSAADDIATVKKESGADDDVESSWESAEDEEAEREEEFKVEVYNFPMRPFVSIRINNIDTIRPIRQDNFLPIGQMKKEFDQIDRCLITASQTHIVYAQMAHKKDASGFRIIRQDNGRHKQVFRSTGERIFSVQLCNSSIAGHDIETILGTGVNGSVYWSSLSKSRAEQFQDDDVEAQGIIMPPVQTAEEQSSGSQVKTRAKMSSRHPEYFAVSRGKQINIIAPEAVKSRAYCDSKTRKVNTAKYLAEHGLRIMTVKACKDFCFSEDDTMIVSLDKSGRFKFWDVKDLTSRASDITKGKHDPIELEEPIWELVAATSGSKPEEKPSVSSIMFLDKARPTQRGAALRYMLIGFKQNHILQLWDLGLGKAVQEIRLPHEKDSDGICSVAYHPGTGIISIGHPTRNSIYFIHLSAPKYNIPQMEQAKYVRALAIDDRSIPKPESTAIMSGLREFSFAKVGQLRSLDMLRQPLDTNNDTNDEDATQFELYIMHHRGAVGMSVKRKDLGWDKDSKMVKPIDAQEVGAIEVSELIPPQKLQGHSEQSSNAEVPPKTTAKPSVAKKHEPAKPSVTTTPKAEVMQRDIEQTTPMADGATARVDVAKQASEPLPRALPLAGNPVTINADSYAMAAQRAASPARERGLKDAANAAKVVAASTPSVAVPTPATFANDDLQSVLSKQFDALYNRIDADKRVQDAAGSAKQDAMLRLVSSTLTENVEKSLARIVSENMTKEIVPNVTSSVNKTVEKKLSETLPQQLNSQIAKEVKAALPTAIQQALKDPQVHNTISNQVSQKVQQQVSQLLQQSLPSMATQATQKMVSDLENRTKQQQREADTRRQQDNAKIQELSNLVHTLSQTIQNMSESQTAFQEQILKMQRPGSSKGRQESSRDADSAAELAAEPKKTAEEEEVDKITQLLMAGEYDAATISWLQSERQGELFDQVFLRVNPLYLGKVTPLVALSVSAAITASFESHVTQRLEWLGTVLDNINLDDTEIKEVAPKIMEVLSQRLQGAYMNISEANPNEPSLRRISALNRQIVDIRRLAG